MERDALAGLELEVEPAYDELVAEAAVKTTERKDGVAQVRARRFACRQARTAVGRCRSNQTGRRR
jgi:hypothetical protein